VFHDLVQGQAPETPNSKGKSMTVIKRNKVYKVRFSDAEVQKIKDANILNIAKYLRDTSLSQIDAMQGSAKKKNQENHYTKLDRDFLLELSRIGGNINQIAKALNIDTANNRPLDVARLLHLLIGIDQTLKELKK
jgi:uncharacterized hydantoinase/oxoprolinase family protein